MLIHNLAWHPSFTPHVLTIERGIVSHINVQLTDGKKIDGRRIVVDVERGRTVKSWRPRRLGKVTKITQFQQ